jgi:hypothetical protein
MRPEARRSRSRRVLAPAGPAAVAVVALAAAALLAGCGRTAPSAKSGTGARTVQFSDTPTPSASAAARGGAFFTDPKLVAEVLAVAQDDAAIVGTYDYRDVTATLTQALRVTTGAFRASYQRSLPVLADTAVRNKIIQTVTVVKGAVVRFGAGSKQAVVLLVIKQAVAKGPGATPTVDYLTITETLQRVGGQWLVSDLQPHGSTGVPPGTAALAAAELAARRMVLDTLTYSRARFSTDFARTLAATTGSLRSYVNSHRTEIRRAMVEGGFDLRGELDGDAVESATGSTVVVLVAAKEYKLTDTGRRTLATAGRFEVTMTKVGDTWLASKLDAVGAG